MKGRKRLFTISWLPPCPSAASESPKRSQKQLSSSLPTMLATLPASNCSSMVAPLPSKKGLLGAARNDSQTAISQKHPGSQLSCESGSKFEIGGLSDDCLRR